MKRSPPAGAALVAAVCAALLPATAAGVDWPPVLPGGKAALTITGAQLLRPVAELREGVTVAETPPEITFLYYGCQTYEGNPWSVWGDGLAVDGHYYSAVGDHRSPEGNAFLYDFDSATGTLTELADVRSIIGQRDGWYTPGKIHSRIDLGSDGWLYYSTHRGSTRVADDPENHFEGDWILRTQPETGESEIVVHAPLEMQSLPTGMLDAQRMIWYAGTADGLREREPQFLAYDVAGRQTVFAADHGPHRAMILAPASGHLYFHGGGQDDRHLYRFDPAAPAAPERLAAEVGLRAASTPTPDGLVYTIDRDELWVFDTATEQARSLGPAAVAGQDYTTSIDVDRTGRYLYYLPGAHGGSELEGTPVVQYDTRTRTRKILCFLHPALQDTAGYIPIGSFSSALSPDGGTLYVTWNGAHAPGDTKRRVPFQSVAMTAIAIPESERPVD